jgi:hypothetical protein
MVALGGKRIGLYPSLDEALDRKHRWRHPIGSEYFRLRDGAMLARIVSPNERKYFNA